MSNGFQTTLDHNHVRDAQQGREFARSFHSLLGVRRTVKSTIAAVVAGSLHSNKKSLSAELRRLQGFGVDVTLLNLGFDVTDFNSLPLITNDLME